MIEGRFGIALARYPERPFLLSSTSQFRYADFFQYCRRLASGFARLKGNRLACHMADSTELVAIMLAAGMSGKSLLMLNRDFTDQQLPDLLQRYDIDVLISDSVPEIELSATLLQAQELQELVTEVPLTECSDGEILILTSGTTGQPRCARYTWPDLFAQVSNRPALEDERWLLAYRLNHFAGLQMLVHVLHNGSTLVLAESNRVPHALNAMQNHSVTHCSSTPTFWRYALATLPTTGHELALKHITLGSEPVSAALLDQLQEVFPAARIVHIYASTEAGSCVSVSDMRPGLPVSVLQRDKDADVQFRVVEDELYIRSAHGMKGYAGVGEVANRDEEGWLASGDLVRIENDRILFMGRRSETINVGGVKVHPVEVEDVISALPGVKLARVFGQPNPVTGQIVAVDVVINDGYTNPDVEAAVREACQALSRHARPRSINFVDAIETNNFKLKRR
ncbi:MAG TPA: class I adenylate-forming enzyme family protein [Halioglobus sp.]